MDKDKFVKIVGKAASAVTYPVVLYTCIFFSCLGMFAILRANVTEVSSESVYILSVVSDGSLLTLICMLFRGKWKIIIFPLLLIVSFFLLINLWYFRYFGDFIPASLYSISNPFNEAATNGARSVLRWYDIFVPLVSQLPLIFVAATSFKRFFKANAGKWEYLTAGLFFIVSWTGILLYSSNRLRQFTEVQSVDGYSHIMFLRKEELWTFTYGLTNMTFYGVRCVANSTNAFFKLSDSQKEEMSEYFRNKAEVNHTERPENYESPENIILIIVESLPTVALENRYSEEAAPYLMSLLEDDKEVNVSAKALVGYGISSDAQFALLTGLLPLRNEPWVERYGLGNYPSLPKAFGGDNMEIICEKWHIWNHHLTTRSFGFHRLIDAVASFKVMAQDSLLFDRAERELDVLSPPFFLLLTTLSMHEGYEYEGVTRNPSLRLEGMDDPFEREYYQRLNHFDRNLESFIDFLKQQNLYDSTLIIIVGDHQPLSNNSPEALKVPYVPMIILNSPLKEVRQREFTQVDLFPTVLDIMNIHYRYRGYPYTGVGSSIFVEAEGGLGEEDYKMSEWMIKGEP